MSKHRAFQEQSYTGERYAFGKEGEATVRAWLLRQPGVVSVRDVSEVPELRASGFDFACKLNDGRVVHVEVKTDDHLGKSGNIAIEICRVRTDAQADFGLLGWSLRSKCDWLVWYAPATGEIWHMTMRDYRAGMAGLFNQRRSDGFTLSVRLIPTDPEWSTLLITIPEKWFKISKHGVERSKVEPVRQASLFGDR